MILVTGATGRIGREVVKQLAVSGFPMRAMVRDDRKAELLKDHAHEIVVADFSVEDSMRNALDGIESVFLSSPSHPRQVEWEANVVRAAKKEGIRHIVKISTLGAKPEADLSMSRWHGESEKMITESGIPYTFLRCHNFMQNLFGLIPEVISDSTIRLPVGSGKVAMIDARDVAAAAVATLTETGHENKIYRLTGGEALSFYEIAEAISNVIGKEVTYRDICSEDARKEMLKRGVADWLVDDLIRLYDQFRDGKGARVWDDFYRITGRQPIIFQRFVSDYTHRFKEQSDTA
ncbi:NAD(P)-dependent oxidoreductase [candidate division LCP-89 bacterium B3_LCP]|uniref:NAD(P)-dependent oxidoreductase n=1 Tax=candidate division LCP-89 bacterium B3_LCP TaxID=2012998 RepID=A0A532UPK2_UNCL8|nr:MAG: NAD(P)-dependent oxidoreductase [candidate division LCP-89 bacterium B3_LCP]